MPPLRVMSIFGTRPDAIKMAPVVRALQAARPLVEPSVCVTAQHRQMLDEILTTFEVQPDYDLDLMRPDQSLSEITARILERLAHVFADARPDIVLVHGDTATSTAAALSAFYHRIPVGHVEAGLRTGDPMDPFPEEMNRRLTGRLASYHFAPTEQARRHLLRENVPAASISVTGNTVIDAFLAVSRRAGSTAPPGWERLRSDRPVVFVTAHRRENHSAMPEIARAMREIVNLPGRPQIYWPVHPSPHVAPVVHDILDGVEGVVLVDPIAYTHVVDAVKACAFVLTDSGGLQEEAPVLGKPVLVMRETTERPEGLQAGTLELIGTDRHRIVATVNRLLSDAGYYARMSHANNPYGDGHAARRIVDILLAAHGHGVLPAEFRAVA
ncbi:MAG: UDP-N-acetylglucosamine 2-epimerase (non-hydrolyzing) [Candidatus Velthaea sp.]